MGKHLVLIGGGHAHMVTLANLRTFIEKGHKVTVIGPSAYHYYSGMGPGMLGETYTPDDIRFATRHVVERQGGTFVLDSATHIDPTQKTVFLKSGKTLSYDALSFNSGSYVPRSRVIEDTGDIFSVKPIETLIQAQKRLLELTKEKKITIGIVGGGPSSAEIGGNIMQLVKRHITYTPQIKIFSGKRFMSRFPDVVRKKTIDSLTSRGIKILENNYVETIRTGEITLASGERHDLDFIFLALGVVPSPIFKKSGLPTGPDGGLLVNRYLQSTKHPELFGGGDCIFFQDQPLNKVGVYAVRENPVLFHNLQAALDGSDLQPFDPGGKYLLIFNMGEGKGILHKAWVTIDGKFAFMLKNYIDLKFMKKFKEIERV